jgi:hypothetical protein
MKPTPVPIMPTTLPPLQKAGAVLARAGAARAQSEADGFEAVLHRADEEPGRKQERAAAQELIVEFVCAAPAVAAPLGQGREMPTRISFSAGARVALPPAAGSKPAIGASSLPRAAGISDASRVAPPPADLKSFGLAPPPALVEQASLGQAPDTRRPRVESAQASRSLPPPREPPAIELKSFDHVEAPSDRGAEPRRPRVESAPASRSAPPPRDPSSRIAEAVTAPEPVTREDGRSAPRVEAPTPNAVVDPSPRRSQEVAAPAVVASRPVARSAESAAAPPSTPGPMHALRLEIAAPGLGSVSLGLRLREAALDLRVRVVDAQGAAAIEREAPALVERLREAGYAVETVVVERRDGTMDANSDARREAGGESARQAPRRKARDETKPETARTDPRLRDGVYL